MTSIQEDQSLAAINEKLNELLELKRQLEPYLPLLQRMAANPAWKFRQRVTRKEDR